jgi:hypothetical protein
MTGTMGNRACGVKGLWAASGERENFVGRLSRRLSPLR